MKLEIYIDGQKMQETHIPKNIDVTTVVRNGEVKYISKSVREMP